MPSGEHYLQWSWPAGLQVNAFPHIDNDIASAATGQMTYAAAVADMQNWLNQYLPSSSARTRYQHEPAWAGDVHDASAKNVTLTHGSRGCSATSGPFASRSHGRSNDAFGGEATMRPGKR